MNLYNIVPQLNSRLLFISPLKQKINHITKKIFYLIMLQKISKYFSTMSKLNTIPHTTSCKGMLRIHMELVKF